VAGLRALTKTESKIVNPRILEDDLREKVGTMGSETHDNLFIGGDFVPAKSTARVDLINPATEELIARVPDADGRDVDRAVEAARQALPAWSEVPGKERAKIISAIADGIQARAAEIDALTTMQNGAPGSWASYVGSGAHFLYRMFVPLAENLVVEEPRESASGRSLFRHEPIGVVGAIVPWNSPQILLASKLAPALAAGCTVVAKPSPETSLDCYVLAEILNEAGLPPGVVNIVMGGRETGASIVRHAGVDMVSFTGSTAAGRSIASVCGEQLKLVSAELGGKSAAVLLEDTDLDLFSDSIFSEVVPYSGQVCYTNSRILVHQSRFDEVLELLRATFEKSPVGDPTDPSTAFGPLITPVQREKVEGLISSGLAEGARLVMGGGRPSELTKGYYVEPTIFVDVQPQMRIFQEEIFGPVVCVVPFLDDEEAVALANDSNYGLAGSVFGREIEHATNVARRMETGRIMVNNGRGATRATRLFKGSGLGSVGVMDSVALFQQTKNITLPV
jgi:betaine-aldehyde dehydrogenase